MLLRWNGVSHHPITRDQPILPLLVVSVIGWFPGHARFRRWGWFSLHPTHYERAPLWSKLTVNQTTTLYNKEHPHG